MKPLDASKRTTPEYWPEATKHLARVDPVLRELVRKHREADFRLRGDAFQALARAIVGQQISVKAAQSIWARFEQCVGKVTPANVVARDAAALRACGFSGQKVSYVKDLARRFHCGEVKPRRWNAMDDEAIIEELVAVKGIGRWTAEMFLMFHLQRPDVLPLGDLGVVTGFAKVYGNGTKLTADQINAIGDAWRPYRSIGAWYMWRAHEA